MPENKREKIAIITQARMSSTRLPGKIFIPVKGKEVLRHHVDRLSASGLDIIVATSTEVSDTAVADFCKKNNWNHFRGSLEDVLSRYYESALHFGLKHVVRVTSDCPLIDGRLIAQAVEEYFASGAKNIYYSNCIERTYPRGFDFEIFSFDLLKEAWEKAKDPALREHVTPYIHKNISGNVRLVHFKRKEDASRFRITLDTDADLLLIRQLIEKYNADQLNAEEIIRLMETHPELHEINRHIEQKKI